MITIARNVKFSFLRGGGSSLEVLYGKVSLTPTNLHTLSSAAVLPAPTTFDLVNGTALATNVATTPAPIDGTIAWAYKVKITDNFGKSWEYLVGVPDGTTEINFNVLPRYSETRPPAFGVGPAGPAGQSATIAIGTTTSGPTPAVTNTGTSTDAVLNFTLAKGDKGDTGAGVASQYLGKLFADLPDAYPSGMTLGLYRSSDGWPYSFTNVQTFKHMQYGQSIFQIMTPYAATSGEVQWRKAVSASEWGPLTPFRGDLATPLMNGLMPALDKAKLDGMTPAANSKTFAALASTYPTGFSTLQVRAADGWPIATNAQVVTFKTIAGVANTTQWLYSGDGAIPQFRVADSAGVWGEVRTNTNRKMVENVLDWGADPTGVVDSTEAFRAAHEAATGRVFAPAGRYLITETLNYKKYLRGEEGTVLFSPTNITTILQFAESYLASTKKELAAPVTSGDRVMTTKTVHGYLPGDILRFVSQRVSTGDDMKERMGWATGSDPGPFVAEFVRVASVETANSFTLDTGIFFADYRHNDALDTAVGSGPSAYFQKTSETITSGGASDLEFEGDVSYCLRVLRAKNLNFKRLKFKSNRVGRFIQYEDCYMVDSEECSVVVNEFDDSTGHDRVNSYHNVGSWKSGFTRCKATRGTQAFDITYSLTGRVLSAFCYVRDCITESARDNPITCHPGVYGARITGNDFVGCQKSGMAIRANASIVTGNRVTGSLRSDDANPGIYLSEGGGKNSLISNNYIENFSVGIRINDGTGKPFEGVIGANIIGNEFVNFKIGYQRTRTLGRPIPIVSEAILVKSNVFKSDFPTAIGVVTCDAGRGERGLIVSQNDFILNAEGSASTCIVMSGNTKGLIVADNTVHQAGRFLTYTATNYQASGGADVVELANNRLINVTSSVVPVADSTFGVISLGTEVLTMSTSSFLLTDFRYPGRFRVSSSASITAANGFPFEGGQCWWEVIRLADSSIVHKIYREGTVPEIYSRRSNGASWFDFKKLAFS